MYFLTFTGWDITWPPRLHCRSRMHRSYRRAVPGIPGFLGRIYISVRKPDLFLFTHSVKYEVARILLNTDFSIISLILLLITNFLLIWFRTRNKPSFFTQSQDYTGSKLPQVLVRFFSLISLVRKRVSLIFHHKNTIAPSRYAETAQLYQYATDKKTPQATS